MPLTTPRMRRQAPRLPPGDWWTSPRRRRRVLLVDPCPDTLESMKWLLKFWEYDAVAAETGGQALRLVLTDPVDAVVMELRLPDLNGWDVAERMRAGCGLACPPLIAVSVLASLVDRLRSREAGFDCHLVKPAPPEVIRLWLQRTSHQLLERSAIRRRVSPDVLEREELA